MAKERFTVTATSVGEEHNSGTKWEIDLQGPEAAVYRQLAYNLVAQMFGKLGIEMEVAVNTQDPSGLMEYTHTLNAAVGIGNAETDKLLGLLT